MKNRIHILLVAVLAFSLTVFFGENINQFIHVNVLMEDQQLEIPNLAKRYKYEIVQQEQDVIHLLPGEEKEISLTIKNTGDADWYLNEDAENQLLLVTYLPFDKNSFFYDASSEVWKNSSQIYIVDQGGKEVIEPGELVDFSFPIKAPEYPGVYRENFLPLVEGVKGLNNAIIVFDIIVDGDFSESYDYQIVEKTEVNIQGFNGVRDIKLSIMNNGKVPWYKEALEPLSLIVAEDSDASLFKSDNLWKDEFIISNIQAKREVLPGEIADFVFQIKAPSIEGDYSFGVNFAVGDLFVFSTTPIVWDIKVREKLVALTFDDGYGDINEFLDLLAEEKVKATFFILGVVAQDKPDDMIRIISEGHLLANHSYDHPDFRLLTEDSIRWQLDQTRQVMKQITGIDNYPYFRYPFGAHNALSDSVLEANGWKYFQWTNDTSDYKFHENTAKGREHIYYFATLNPPKQAIVLMHIISKSSLAVLPDIIDWYRENNYTFVTVDEI